MSSQPHFILPLHSTQQTRRPHRSNPPSPSFAVPHSPTSSSSGVENASLQWDEKHAPHVPDELAVRRQKLDTMRSMIKHSALHMRQGIKLIALTGPTGAGKSTAARVLVRDMGYQVTEWVNPLRDGDYDPEHHESIMTRFDRFMDRATRPFSLESRQPKIILFDDLPDLTTPSLLQQFVAILKSYVESQRDFLMIMVISESSMQQDDGRRWRQRQYESGLLTANQILTKDMLATGRCAELEFNPVIKVNVKKVCGAILEKEKLLTHRTMDLIEHITDVCHGDLRCSIVTLQLYTLGEPVSNQTVESLKKRKRKRPSGRPSRSAAAYDSDFESSTQDSTSGRGENSNDNVHGRDDPLDLFHCIGKILFAKRENGRLASRPPAVLERSPFDHDQLLAWIFHNYDDFIVDVDQSALLMDHMADADVIGNNWMESTCSEYQMLVSMFGTMTSLTDGRDTGPRGRLTFRPPDDAWYRMARAQQQQHQPQSPSLSHQHERIQQLRQYKQAWRPIIGTATTDNTMEAPDSPILGFSEDEFDDIYGDGSEWADVEFE